MPNFRMDEDSLDRKAKDRLRTAEKDKAEIAELREYYKPWLEWTDRGILHELKVKRAISSPSNDLLRHIAMGVSHEHGIPLGRQEKRRRDLVVGWLNKHFSYVDVDTLVVQDTIGPIVGTPEAIAILSGIIACCGRK